MQSIFQHCLNFSRQRKRRPESQDHALPLEEEDVQSLRVAKPVNRPPEGSQHQLEQLEHQDDQLLKQNLKNMKKKPRLQHPR